MSKLAHKWLFMIMALLMIVSVCPLAQAEGGATGADDPAVIVSTETAAVPETKDWTVMLYLCGTDLETDNGMATINLVEIAETIPSEKVNMVIETGGTRRWRAEDALGLKIDAEKLQRWSFDAEG